MDPAAACSKPCLSTVGGRSAPHDRVFVWAHCDCCNCSFSVNVHFLEQSHSWKTDSFSGNQDILRHFGSRHFVTVFSTVRKFFVPEPDKSSPLSLSHPATLRSLLILACRVPQMLFSSTVRVQKILLFIPVLANCTTHVTSLDLATLKKSQAACP